MSGGHIILGKYVGPDRNSCPTLGKFVWPMSGCNFLHELRGGSESAQAVTRLIDLFVDIAVLLRKLVYRFSGILIHLPRRTPAELLDTCTMLPLK